VNRHKDKAITADVTNTSGMFTGSGEISIITTKELQEAFTFDKQKEYVPEKKYVDIKNNEFSYTFLPHSFTQIKMGVNIK
jgi:alpha-N-arabinofuranosidase